MTGRRPTGFHLDMPFEEALERYAGVPIKEIEANEGKSKKKKPKRAQKPARSGDKDQKSEKVISLKDRKTSRRRRGLA
jgi:hypothetical protein